MLVKPLLIGGRLLLAQSLVLAPLEGVSDVGFRQLLFKNNMQFTWTEMTRASAITRKNKSSLDLIDTFDEFVPTGVQLSAKSATELISALDVIQTLALDGSRPHYLNIKDIQLNFGCPSPDVIREGAGPALLKRKKRLNEIFQALVQWKESNLIGVKSVGCKIRLGLNSNEVSSKVYMNVIDAANSHNLDYVVVHARHAKQKSSDQPDWLIIKEIKLKSAFVPIIGNGNALTLKDAKEMSRVTGCDSVMIARAAIANPWAFKHYPEGEEDNVPSLKEVLDAKAIYINLALQSPNRNPKYEAFHLANFKRLESCAETRNFPLKFSNPSKIYI